MTEIKIDQNVIIERDDAPRLSAISMVNWSRYLESLCNTYIQWWQVYTITDVMGHHRVESEPSPLLFYFDLMVQTVIPRQQAEALTFRSPFTLARTQNVERQIFSRENELALPYI